MVIAIIISTVFQRKESKSPLCGVYTDRSSSLVWMTHSHCVRSNPAKVVGPNPTRSIIKY